MRLRITRGAVGLIQKAWDKLQNAAIVVFYTVPEMNAVAGGGSVNCPALENYRIGGSENRRDGRLKEGRRFDRWAETSVQCACTNLTFCILNPMRDQSGLDYN